MGAMTPLTARDPKNFRGGENLLDSIHIGTKGRYVLEVTGRKSVKHLTRKCLVSNRGAKRKIARSRVSFERCPAEKEGHLGLWTLEW